MKTTSHYEGECKICQQPVYESIEPKPSISPGNQPKINTFEVRVKPIAPPLCRSGQEHRLDIFSLK